MKIFRVLWQVLRSEIFKRDAIDYNQIRKKKLAENLMGMQVQQI